MTTTKKTVGIIESPNANIASVCFALQRLGISFHLSHSATILEKTLHIIFPGVGHASSTMNFLKERGLDQFIISCKKPFLGICLGMQLMFDFSEENMTEGLGLIPGTVKKFAARKRYPVPHMGWNSLNAHNSDHGLFKDIAEGEQMYFVHSYALFQCQFATSYCDYGQNFVASVRRDNFYGVQFHPEKSQRGGQTLIKNFVELT